MFYILWRNKLCGNWDVHKRETFGTLSRAEEVKAELQAQTKHHYRIVFSEEEL